MDNHERQRSMNVETLAALKEQGSNLLRGHNLQNVFHVHSANDVAAVAQRLRGEGFCVTEEGTKYRDRRTTYYLVEVSIERVPDIQALHAMTDCCTRIAQQFDADYDGWYTEVVE